jgi:hypothetical protein
VPVRPPALRSLHYFGSGMPNQYETAIKAVGEIIEDYDTDKLFPVLGFGARLPPDGRISHCFYVNGHDSNPYCQRMSGRMMIIIDTSLDVAFSAKNTPLSAWLALVAWAAGTVGMTLLVFVSQSSLSRTTICI